MTPDKVKEIYWSIHAHSDDELMESRHKAVIAILTKYHQDLMSEVRLEERGLIRYAIKALAEKHGGVVEEILNGIVRGLDEITEEESQTIIKSK